MRTSPRIGSVDRGGHDEAMGGNGLWYYGVEDAALMQELSNL